MDAVRVVPKVGLEPTRALSPLGPEPSASANSATSAQGAECRRDRHRGPRRIGPRGFPRPAAGSLLELAAPWRRRRKRTTGSTWPGTRRPGSGSRFSIGGRRGSFYAGPRSRAFATADSRSRTPSPASAATNSGSSAAGSRRTRWAATRITIPPARGNSSSTAGSWRRSGSSSTSGGTTGPHFQRHAGRLLEDVSGVGHDGLYLSIIRFRSIVLFRLKV